MKRRETEREAKTEDFFLFFGYCVCLETGMCFLRELIMERFYEKIRNKSVARMWSVTRVVKRKIDIGLGFMDSFATACGVVCE